MKLQVATGLAVAALATASVIGVRQSGDGSVTVVPAGEDGTTRSVQPLTPASDIGTSPQVAPRGAVTADEHDDLVRQARASAELAGVEEAP